jgi:peptide-methionine (S)-S-oxide reductase
VIFFHDDEQQRAALRSKAREQARYRAPIATAIERAQTFWLAEERHQHYLEQRGRATCTPALRDAASV